jgi:hypothetical protein
VACNQCRDDGLRCSLKRYQTGPCKNCKEIDENCKFILIPQSAKLVSNTTTSVKAGSAGKKPKSKKRNSKNKKKKRKQRPKKTRKAKKKGTIRGSRHAPLPPPGPKPRETQGIVHIVIRTSFAHPITFNHIPAPDGASPCSWCSSPFFGLFGHGEREVEVIPWPGGHGYEEIGLPLAEKIDPISNINSSRNINNRGSSNSNNIIHAKDNAEEKKDLRGHNQLGEERSRMCVPCTFQRVHIMACDTHQMLPMDDIDPRIFDSKEWDRAVVALERGDEEGSKIVTGSKWCSVCPALAEYRCVAKQESIFGDDDDFETKRGGKAGERQCEKGCGLLLCETCKDILGKLEAAMKFSTAQGPRDGNVLDRLVRVVQGDRFHYPIGARADAGFLTLEGELNCRLEKGFGEDMSVKMECEGEKGGEEDDEGDDELDELMMDGERSASENGGWDGDEDVFFKAEERSEDSDKGKRGGELEVIVISDDED